MDPTKEPSGYTYGDTGDGVNHAYTDFWKVTYDNGTVVKGKTTCRSSSTKPDNGYIQSSSPYAAGTNCWCSLDNAVYGASVNWIRMSTEYAKERYCARSCSLFCGQHIQNDAEFRTTLFNAFNRGN